MRHVAGDRTVVIPLSGGYDSRLLACLCKKYGFPRVICYTYGIKSSPEVNVSRDVARKLGFDWLFVEYTQEKWARFIASPDFEGYLHYGGNLKAIAHIQDLLAIRELKEKSLLPENAVIMPGHSGDVLGGSHLPSALGKRNIVKKLFGKYFNVNFLTKPCRRLVLNALAATIETEDDKEESLLEAFFAWGFRNRQANFIVNSVRAYEYEGYDWYLPLWDDEFVRYWCRIPCTARRGSALYEDALFRLFFKYFEVDYLKSRREISSPVLIRCFRGFFSAEQRYRLKRRLEKTGLVAPERNALDMAGMLIKEKGFCAEEPCVRQAKTDSMGMKSLYYISLLRKRQDARKLVLSLQNQRQENETTTFKLRQ
ncbi:MAG: asparagine synthase C-terminal domain-containing protein [Bacteroides sp.]|nr:asparagine synthase C-terminal domain-containing protein [Bacteroides sp.]